MDFIKELKDRIVRIDKRASRKKPEIVVSSTVTVYNIYKRSLPVGTNKLVALNIPSLKDANILVTACNLTTREEEGKVTYYDIVIDRIPSDDIYYNDPQTRGIL